MKNPIAVIGIGEIGSVFARGFLRLGHPVYPVTRETALQQVAQRIPHPELVIVAVGEDDLHATLADIPGDWRDRLVLLQNELLPQDWKRHGYLDPTVVSIWFEKKKGQDSRVILPSPVFGPHAQLVENALAGIDIPVRVLQHAEQLLFELVRKNVYILTSNIAGLETGGTVGELWQSHRQLAQQVAGDVIRLQEKLTRRTLDTDALLAGMIEAFAGDPQHRCTGRSAPARLQRALDMARASSLDAPALRAIGTQHLAG